MVRDGVIEEVHWVALNPRGPRRVRFGEITLHNVAIDPQRMAEYGKVKEAIWGRIHDIQPEGEHDELFWSDAFSEYTYYNRNTAELIRKLDREFDFDTFYIHDFQQLPVGHMLGTLKPKVFRWHIPFDASTIPEKWPALLGMVPRKLRPDHRERPKVRRLPQGIPSKGRVVRQYPYVDPEGLHVPRPAGGRGDGRADRVSTPRTRSPAVVSDDLMKGHDRAIEAFGHLAGEYDHLKLVLVGNGSFAGSGLGLSKSAKWRTHLETMVQGLGLEGRVVFTGDVEQADLDGLYERCDFTVLPSLREGFGLVAVERPASTSARRSSPNAPGWPNSSATARTASSLIRPWPGHLESQMRRLLDDRTGRLHAKLVRNGRETAKKCSLDAAARAERAILSRITEAKWLTSA